MSDAAGIVAAARGFVGVPWRHRGDTHAGMDCAGLLLAVARALGMAAPRDLSYERLPDTRLVDLLLPQYATRIDAAEPGAVAVLLIARRPQHLGIVAERRGRPSLIHALDSLGVREHDIDARWARRIVSVWRLRGVAPG